MIHVDSESEHKNVETVPTDPWLCILRKIPPLCPSLAIFSVVCSRFSVVVVETSSQRHKSNTHRRSSSSSHGKVSTNLISSSILLLVIDHLTDIHPHMTMAKRTPIFRPCLTIPHPQLLHHHIDLDTIRLVPCLMSSQNLKVTCISEHCRTKTKSTNTMSTMSLSAPVQTKKVTKWPGVPNRVTRRTRMVMVLSLRTFRSRKRSITGKWRS